MVEGAEVEVPQEAVVETRLLQIKMHQDHQTNLHKNHTKKVQKPAQMYLI